ncbi:isoprenoid synthase domain-containing protein [Xylariaceae sp. FL0255]|nr:isoprenoid synthase domain-containing protein [Xylariaceae sp. FL0255]
MPSATAFGRITKDFVIQALSKGQADKISSITQNRIITCFKPVGDAVSIAYNTTQLQKLMDELIFFIDMCQEEHKFQMTQRLPSVEEYQRKRMGSSATRVCLAMTDYAYGDIMPEDIIKDESMKIIWHETNMIISVVNDILSIKKAIAQSQADPLIPLLSHKLGSVQAALDEAARLVSQSIQRFEVAESKLLTFYAKGSLSMYTMLTNHITACKLACTANLNWSLVSGHYLIGCSSAANGVEIQL